MTPYEKFVLYDPAVKQSLGPAPDIAASKSSGEPTVAKVAWFVSNCGASNKRLDYAQELRKHISVDIFGACGEKKCGRSQHSNCQDMLRKNYKFYLAFEVKITLPVSTRKTQTHCGLINFASQQSVHSLVLGRKESSSFEDSNLSSFLQREVNLKFDPFLCSPQNSNCRWYITEKFWVNALQ